MFKQQLSIILKDLNKHKRNKSQLLEEAVQKRLDLSLQTYYRDILESYEFLSSRNALKLARKLNRS